MTATLERRSSDGISREESPDPERERKSASDPLVKALGLLSLGLGRIPEARTGQVLHDRCFHEEASHPYVIDLGQTTVASTPNALPILPGCWAIRCHAGYIVRGYDIALKLPRISIGDMLEKS